MASVSISTHFIMCVATKDTLLISVMLQNAILNFLKDFVNNCMSSLILSYETKKIAHLLYLKLFFSFINNHADNITFILFPLMKSYWLLDFWPFCLHKNNLFWFFFIFLIDSQKRV